MENLFLEGSKITKLAIQAREIKAGGKVFSDIVDSKGNQYVDFVQLRRWSFGNWSYWLYLHSRASRYPIL